jgi:catechol 2,3-dioxygenase-like lactoylglutathione lyase family enzyme
VEIAVAELLRQPRQEEAVSARSRGQGDVTAVPPVDLAVSGLVQNVRRLEASLRFYRDFLGLAVLRREQTAAVLGPLGHDRATLTLHEVGAHAVRGLNEIGPRQIWLSTGTRETFDRLSTVLADSGYTSRRTERPGLRLLRVRDPDGILLHIVFRQPEGRETGDEPISPAVYARE